MIEEFNGAYTHLMNGCYSLREAIQALDGLQIAIEIDVVDKEDKNKLKDQIAAFRRDMDTHKEKLLNIGYDLDTLRRTPLVISLGQ